MPTGLIRRGAAYSLRRRIPKDLIVAFGGRLEIVRALGTKDREEAKRLHAKAWVALDEEFAAARLHQSDDLGAHIQSKLRQIKEAWKRDPRPVQTITDEELEYALEKMAFDCEEELREEVERDARELERHQLLAVLNVQNLDLLSKKELALRDIILDLRREKERAEERAREAEAKARARAVPPSIPVPQSRPAQVLSSTLEGLIARWALERSPTAKTVRAHAAVVRWFSERTGILDVGSITRAHVQDFKTKLIDEGTSAANVGTKLSRLRTILNFAVGEGVLPSNPSNGVAAPPSKGGKRRLPFSSADLTKLFAGPVHRLGERPIRGRGEAAYWMPLLALFTGARREELGQLRKEDVATIAYNADGVEKKAWFFRIRLDEEGKNRLKTASSERLVPVHASLIDLGLLKLVASRPAGALLFPDLKPSGDGALTEKWGQWFSSYRLACGITDRRLTFHSFRHAFMDCCREAGIEVGIAKQLVGHKPSDVTGKYGLGFSTHVLVNAIRSYKVPGFILPPPSQGGTTS